MKGIFNSQNINLLYKQRSPSSNIISPFIVEGEFLNHRPRINPNYSINNFEYIRDYNNELIEIGKGGYGKLYLAKNKKDNKEYAIKYVSKKKMQSVGVDFSIIKREIDIHIRITHPRIIKLYSYFEDKFNFYLAMEYAPNGTLYHLIQIKKGMSENEAFYYFIQVASAIYFLHEHGYAHRDIKPENILLDGKGGIKLCDFGWCVNVTKGERTTFCGTYEYMAPEMINDEFYDKGIDIWSLGVLLYEMIHGYSPFRAHKFVKDAKAAQVEIFMNIKNNNYTINKNISEECIDLIDKLLTTDTKKRIKIDELFKHSWVVNKEKEYFPNYNRYKEIKNNDMINSHRRIETDINCISSLDNIRNIIKYANININNNSNEVLYRNKIINSNENENNTDNIRKHNKNKSYCLIYSKGNSNNNAIYFINGKSGNKNKIEEISSKPEKEKEKDKNRYEYNVNLTETNKDLINNKNANEINQRIEKKEINSKNNFVFSINSKRKKINLPRVIRPEMKNENNILKTPHESQEIKSINSNLKEKFNINQESLTESKNHSREKNDKKQLIRVQKQELDNYIKKQNEINSNLSLKNQKIKEKQELVDLVINKLKQIEEKKIKDESNQKMHDSQKSNTSSEFYNKKKSFKSPFSYLNYKLKKDLGTYSIKNFKKENENKKHKYSNQTEKLKDKRSKSFQQLLTEKSLENKMQSILKEKRNKNNINMMNNIKNNYINNDKNKFKNINNNGEDDISIKDNFKRFRKMVVHLKIKDNLKINTKNNLYNSCDFKYKKNDNRILKSGNPPINIKSNKSIQNIFYNTFYNCLFNNGNKNNYYNSSIKNIYKFNNKKGNILNNKQKEYKSISVEKDIFKYKKNFDLNSRIEYPNKLNKGNELINYSTERKKGKIYIHSSGLDNKDKNEKNI